MKKNVLVGVCGGIAAYKTCELVRLSVKAEYDVKVMMTESACKFVTPLTFQNLSRNPVYVQMFDPIAEENTKHISLAQWADVCVIAPASANTISKIAYGFCDNLLTTVICALPATTKVVIAPAMNTQMWENPIIKENIAKLARLKKYIMVHPEFGELACGAYGAGRMPEPAVIVKKIVSILK